MENVLSLKFFSSCLIYPCLVTRFICDKTMSFDKTNNFEWIKRKYNWKLKSFVLGMVAHTCSPRTQWRQKDCQEFQISQDDQVISRANHCWAKDGSKTLPTARQAKHSPIELHTHRDGGRPWKQTKQPNKSTQNCFIKERKTYFSDSSDWQGICISWVWHF